MRTIITADYAWRGPPQLGGAGDTQTRVGRCCLASSLLLCSRRVPRLSARPRPLHCALAAKAKAKSSRAAALRATRSSTAHPASCLQMQQLQRCEIETWRILPKCCFSHMLCACAHGLRYQRTHSASRKVKFPSSEVTKGRATSLPNSRSLVGVPVLFRDGKYRTKEGRKKISHVPSLLAVGA